MTVTRNLLALMFVALLAFAFVACGDDDDAADADNAGDASPTAAASSGEFPITLERSDGADLTLEAPVERIV